MVMVAGSPVEFGEVSGTGRSHSLAKFMTNQGMIVYERNNAELKAVIVTGASPPTLGSAIVIEDPTDGQRHDVGQVTDSKAIAFYSSTTEIKAVHLTDSGGTPVASTKLVVQTAGDGADYFITPLTSLRSVATWSKGSGASQKIYVAEINTSGANPSIATAATDTGLFGWPFAVSRLDDTRVLMSYSEYPTQIKCVVIDTSGGFTVGTASIPTGASGGTALEFYKSVVRLSSDKSYMTFNHSVLGDTHMVINTSGTTAPTYGVSLATFDGNIVGIDSDTIMLLRGDVAETYDINGSIVDNADDVDFVSGSAGSSSEAIISASGEAIVIYLKSSDTRRYAVRLTGVPTTGVTYDLTHNTLGIPGSII